ncbi:MAG: C4-type zinc ribbon domain-containing protein [bacterium]|nr:C4-type zinc ribbon domain-containing protein [bacterium]
MQQISLLAQLSAVDAELDDLHDDLGDLPQIVKRHETVVRDRTQAVEATQKAIRDLEHLRGTAHVTLQELQDKETRLAEQQFQVKNNREFDAITKEMEGLKAKRAEMDDVLRTGSVREENLQATLEQQQRELDEAKEILAEKEHELEELSGDQNDELKKYIELRRKLVPQIDNALETEYERIRTFHREAVVPLRKNSCSGCYSAIPSQRIMEMKYNREKIYTCENCGRILYCEDVAVDVATVVEGNV